MKIAVIEDERPARSELTYLLRQILEDAEIDEAGSGSEGLALITENTYDFVFVDIHLGDIKGLDLVPVIRRLHPETKVIFSTAYSEYATKAFELQVDDYVLKPFEEERLTQVLNRFTGAASSSAEPASQTAVVPEKMAITCDKESRLLEIEDVVFIETDGQGRGSIVHTNQGRSYNSGTYLGDYEKKLQHMTFFRIHKSYLVNLRYIISIFPWEGGRFGLKLKGYEQQILPVGRDKMKELKKHILV